MGASLQESQPGYERALELLRGMGPVGLASGVQALEAAVQAGEPDAACLMAAFTADGIGIPQDWDRAFDLLLEAALAGSSKGRAQLGILARLSEPRSASSAADDRIWRDLRRAIDLKAWIAPCEKQVLSTSPRVVAIAGFLSAPTCAWLVERGRGRLKPALLYGTGSQAPQQLKVRTNSAFEINVLDLDLVVLMVKARIASTIGAPTGALEPAQVLHYDVGEQFAPHRDYLNVELPPQAADIARRGQRIATFLVYLNDGFEGGETDFPILGLAHKGGVGGALYFGNVDASNKPDPRTLHSGLAPTRGEKWLFSQWVRDRAPVRSA